jgi:hypothetical protein
MIEAAQRATPTTYLFDGEPQNIWSAMIAAAPAPDAWRYPVLTARGEAIERMAKAMRNGKAWPAVFAPKAAEQLAEDALAALEAAAPVLSSKPVDDTSEAGSSIKLPLEAAAPPPTSLQKTQTSAPAPDGLREAVWQAVMLGGDAWGITDRVIALLEKGRG